MHGALIRYRVMAFVVGTALLILTGIVIAQVCGAHVKTEADIVAPIHGYLYIVYLITAADLARRAHWRLGRILTVVAAGFVPTLAFFVEHRVYQQMQTEFAAEAAVASGSSPGSDGSAGPVASAGTVASGGSVRADAGPHTDPA